MPLVFTHANVDFPGCDTIVGGDCTRYGIPVVENEVIDFTLNLGVSVDVTAFALTYGITDRIDFGVVLPVVKTSLRGSSEATIIPFASGGTPPHFFAGTEEDPVFTASRFVEGSSSGIGDVSARVKVNLRSGTPVSLARAGRRKVPHRERGGPAGVRRGGAPRARHHLRSAGRLLAPRQPRLPVPRARSRIRTSSSSPPASTTCSARGPRSRPI